MTTWLTDTPLDLDALLEQTEDPSCGGVVVFSGDIRNHNDGRRVTGITFEAHEALASKAIKALEQEVLARFDVAQCRIQHRTGDIPVGESSVLIVVRAAHRAEAFDGCRHAIDELKERVPIWKHEHYEDGESSYLEGKPLRTE
ncbi:MAG: molybdenum cofactor biosynthesis protein MoaE [Myxococcota bacterium]